MISAQLHIRIVTVLLQSLTPLSTLLNASTCITNGGKLVPNCSCASQPQQASTSEAKALLPLSFANNIAIVTDQKSR